MQQTSIKTPSPAADAARPSVVELEPGVWLAEGEGDPARTLVRENARVFASPRAAADGLTRARRFRPFEEAVIGDHNQQ